MTAKPEAKDLIALRHAMTAKPLESEDLAAVEKAVRRLHDDFLRVDDPSRPWSSDNRAPCDALVVIGAFRAGKTFTVRNAIRRLSPLPAPGGAVEPKPISIATPTMMTSEALARELLDFMRLSPARALGAEMTFERLNTRMRLWQPTLVHIDEAQRLLKPARVALHRQPEEQAKIFGHLRALMDLAGAPTPVILSGTQELVVPMERKDMGFFRDKKNVVFLEPMKVGRQSDRDSLDDALHAFAKAVGMVVGSFPADFFDRLILAVNYARGLGFETCQHAILIAAEEGRAEVSIDDFAAFYARRSGSYRDANPFLAPDWQRVNPTALLATMSGDKAPKIWETAK